MGVLQQAMLTLKNPAAGGFSTPSDLPTIWDWWEPSRDSGTNGVGLQTLTGQSNGRNWTQATSGSRPLYDTTNALNGLAVITFNTDRFWDGPDLTSLGVGTGAGKESHFFLVVKADADPAVLVTDSGLWKLSTASDATVYAFTDGNTYDAGLCGSRSSLGNHATSLAGWHVYEGAMKASSAPGVTDGDFQFRVNGTLFPAGSGNIVGGGPNSTPTFGRNSLGWGFKGKMAGFYISDTLLTFGGSDRDNMISYINTRFGLSSS